MVTPSSVSNISHPSFDTSRRQGYCTKQGKAQAGSPGLAGPKLFNPLADLQDIVRPASRSRRRNGFHRRRDPDTDQYPWVVAVVEQAAHDVAAFVQLDQMGQRTG